ncbi:hypothetical protein ABZ208_13630 [Streptomyces sp. NPDC006208]|uniref:hypothetical protein n=1 Tax=Streptomyces sp. NPDC006208 TaxID=3156734 RepID=UPI0033AC2B9D
MDITAEQIEDLYHGHTSTIDRGDDYNVLRREDVAALVENGDIDTDDDGVPLDHEWQTLAEALSFQSDDSPRERALIAVEDAAARLARAEGERNETIRKALDAGAAVISIANAAGLSRARIYQIRDGRR